MKNLAETGVYGQGGLCSLCAPETLKSHDGSLPPSKSCHDLETHTRVPPWSVLLWGYLTRVYYHGRGLQHAPQSPQVGRRHSSKEGGHSISL